MNQAQDFLEAIEVIVDKKLKSQSSQIYSGLVTAASAGKCSMWINGKVYTNIIVYGNTPTVNSIFPVFVPQNNMSAAFIVVPSVGKDEDDKPIGGGSSGGSSVAIDETLTLSGAAADAKIVGDEIKSVKYVSVKTDTPDGTYDYTGLPVTDDEKLVVFVSDTDSPFAGMNRYIIEGKNIFPNTNRYLSGTSKNGITFETNGRVTHITGAASANTQNYLMNGEALSFPLPEHIAPGDNIVVRTLSAGTINKYVLLTIYFFDANGTPLLSKNHNVHSRSDVSTNLTVPDGAAYFRLAWNVNPGDVSFVYDMYIATAIYKFGETVKTGNSASGGATDIASFPLPMTQLTYSANIRDYIDMIAADNGSLTYDSLGYVTPKMFGAVGDGVADDTEALIAAANSGMPIYFPAGTYLLHQQIDLNKDICWYGDGENTIIKLMPSDKSRPEEYNGKIVYNCYMITSTTENRVNVEMSNIVLDANKDDFDADIYGNGATRYDHTTCFDLKKPASVKLLNVTVKNALIEGCYIWCSSDTKYITIDNCRFINNGYYQKDASGLHIEGDANNAVISNCVFADNGFHGLLIAGDNGKYSNITTHDNGYDGVCIWGGGSHNLLSNIYSFNNRGGIHIKLAYSAWHIDMDDDGYANSNMFENIHTANNKYGIIFGNNQNTKISGWTSEDEYCYALASKKYCSGNIVNELLTPKTAFGESFHSVEANDFTVNFGSLFKEVYPLGATKKGLSTVNFDQILDPDNYPLSESEAVPSYTTLAIELGGLSRSDGTETERSDAVRTVDYIPVLTGKSYTLTNGGGYKVCVLCYDASKNFITNWAVDGEIAYSYKYVDSGKTFNIPNNTAYIRFYSSASSDTSVEYTITNENGNIPTIGSRAEFVKQYFRNHGYAIYGENIDNETMHKLVIEALGLDSNTYNIVEIKAPTSDPQESTICLMNSGNGKTQFVDISSMVYDADKPTVEIVCQTRGGKKLPEFSIGYNDGSGAGRVKKFAVKPDAIPVELTAEGLRIRKTNAFDNNGLDDDYITVNFVDLLDEISGKVPKSDYSPAEKTDAMTQPVGKDANGKLWTAPTSVDDTLTVSGAAADAKIVGDKVGELKGEINELKCDKTADGTYILKCTITNGTPVYNWVSE